MIQNIFKIRKQKETDRHWERELDESCTLGVLTTEGIFKGAPPGLPGCTSPLSKLPMGTDALGRGEGGVTHLPVHVLSNSGRVLEEKHQ